MYMYYIFLPSRFCFSFFPAGELEARCSFLFVCFFFVCVWCVEGYCKCGV